MIKHIVIWKLKDFAEGATKKENARLLKSKLEGLRGIKAVKHLEVGFPMSASVDSWDVALYSEFDNADDLRTYARHPDHVRVSDFITKVRLDRQMVDYEV
jgi:hypothetical protein